MIARTHYKTAFENLDRAARERLGQSHMPDSATASRAECALRDASSHESSRCSKPTEGLTAAMDGTIRAAVSIFLPIGTKRREADEVKIANGALFESPPELAVNRTPPTALPRRMGDNGD